MTDIPEQTLTVQQSDWLEKIKACEASGKSMKAFALSEGLAIKDLYAWKKTLVKKGVLPRTRAPRFQRARIIDGGHTGYEYRLLLPNGVTVMLSGGSDELSIMNLLHSAMQL